jgi:hypothetical protein
MFNRIIKIGLRGGMLSCSRICSLENQLQTHMYLSISFINTGNVEHIRNAVTEHVAWSQWVRFMENSIISRSTFSMHCRHVGILAVWTDERNVRLVHLNALSQEGKGSDYRCHLYKKPDFGQAFLMEVGLVIQSSYFVWKNVCYVAVLQNCPSIGICLEFILSNW